MKTRISLSVCRHKLNVSIACLLSFSLFTMPFIPIASAMSRSDQQASLLRRGKSSQAQPTAKVNVANAPVAAPAPEPFAPVITATKVDALISDDGDGKADPGTTEKIEYTVTISNTGTTDATNVQFTDTIDPHTTLVGGSITTQPIAVNDSYSALGNVRIQVPDGANDLLNNDCDPDPLGGPCTNAGLTVSILAGDNSAPFAGTSAQGGQVTATTGDGSFQYNPAPGFEGPDSFTYTVTDGTGKTDTATVNITVSGMIWFVNAAAGAGGDGRLTSPFNCLVGAGCFSPVAADDPGDNIFLFSGTYNDNAVLTLLNNQKLIGAAATAPLATIAGVTVPTFSDSLPATGGASPVVTSTGSGIQLGTAGNLLRGFTVGNTSTAAGNYDITNTTTSTVGTLNISEVILNGTGGLFRADGGGTLNVVFVSGDTSSAGSNGVQLNNTTGGFTIGGSGTIAGVAGVNFLVSGGSPTISCASNLTKTGSGRIVDFSNYDTSTASFTGNLTCNTGCQGIQVSNDGSASGTVTFSGATKTLSTGTSTAVNLDNNDGGTVNFTGGGLAVTTTSGVGFSAINGGTVNVTTGTNNNTIDTDTGIAVNIVTPTNIGGSGVTFRSVTVDNGASPSAANAIVLNGTTGNFMVTGDGAQTSGLFNRNGTGGTLNRTTGHSVLLTNAQNVTLRQMNITNTAAGGSCPASCTANGINSTGSGNIVVQAVLLQNLGGHGWFAQNLTGTNSFDNNGRVENWQTSNASGIIIDQNNSFTSFTVDNCLFTTSATGADAFLFDGNSGSGAVTVTDSEFTLIDQDAVQINNDGSGTITAVVQRNNFHDADNTSGDGNNTLFMGLAGSGQLNFTIGGSTAADGNTFNNLGRLITLAGVVQVNAVTTSQTGTRAVGSIQHNTISNSTGRRAIDVSVEVNGGSHSASGHSVVIANNTISNIDKQGINVLLTSLSGGSTNNNNFTISGNSLTNVGTEGAVDSGSGIEFEDNFAVANSGGSITANALIQNNSVQNSNTSAVGSTLEINNRHVGGNNISNFQLTILGNTFTNNSAGETFEVLNSGGDGTGAGPTTCLDLNSGNTSPNNSVGGNGTHFKLTNNLGAFNIEGMGASTPSAFLGPKNQSNGISPATITTGGTGAFTSSAGCTNSTALVSMLQTQTTQPFAYANQPAQHVEPVARESKATVNSNHATAEVAKTASTGTLPARTESLRSTRETQAKPLATAKVQPPKKDSGVHSHHARIVRPMNAAPLMAGETVGPIIIGTLRPGDSVVITFQVTVNNPPNLSGVPPGPAQVENQGSVSYAESVTPVLTDDPAGGGAADKTATPVDLFDTSTTLVSDLNPSNFGDLVTFTATVAETPAQGSVDPTGTVDFIDTSNGNAVICNDVALNGSFQAQCQTSTLTAGTHNIRADYSGDGNFDPSQSNIVAQVVIACTPNPIVTSTADNGAGTLREALANVCSGTTITFNIAGAGPHTITLTTGELQVAKNVTINNNSGEKITVSGNNASRVFNINSGKTAAIIGLTMSGGNSAADGGAILNDGTLTIVNSTLSGNTSAIDGGAIRSSATAPSLTLINTTISGNSAAGSGGGVIVLGGTMTSINSTISNNVADSDNNSAGDGGGIRAHAGTTTLKNTIVAGNFNENGASDAADDISGTVDAASSFNLIGTGGAGGLTNGVNSNQVGVSAGIGSLADNGGLTQTHALLATSTAVEAGSNANLPVDTFDLDGDANTAEALPVDQRGTGFPRTADSADANATQTVDIGAFELHPSIEDITNKSTAEDTAVPQITFNIGDGTGSLIASVTATSNNTTLIPNANLVVGGSGTTRTLDITPAANANTPSDGTATITVTVTATNGRTATDTFDVTVTEVNDAPVPTNDTIADIAEDSGVYVIPFATLLANDTNKGAPNESSQTLNITAVSSPTGGTVLINGTNVEFTPTANYFGPAGFTYTVTDNGTTNGVLDAKTGNATVSFNITAVNDPPSFVKGADQTVNEDAGAQTAVGWATSISAGPGETQTLTFNVSITGTTGNLAFSSAPAIDATTGNLTYTTAANTNGTANLSVTLSDNGSNIPPNSNTSAAQTFTITVNAVNDAPTFQLGPNPSVAEDAGLQTINGFAFNFQPGPATATDEAGQTLVGYTVSQTGSTGGLTFSSAPAISNAGTLTFTADANSSGTATFDVVATDSGPGTPPNVNQSAPVSFTITVTGANDAPVNSVPGPQSTNQNTPLTFSSGNGNLISIADVDAGTNVVQVTLTATNGTITLSGTSGLSFSFSDGNGTGAGDGTADPTMTFRGTIANINGALNGMTFTPTLGFSGAATLTITTNDLGNTGTGGPASDTDVVNIQVATNISIQDAQVAEPKIGSVNMVFTVTLSAPAPVGGASVSFTTQDQAPALNHATAGQDYVTTSGTVSFAAGEQVKTIQVPVLSDNKKNEANETFLVVLSSPVNATIADDTATGTIIETDTPGAILITEIRTSGPAGAGDDFVEIYNNSDSPHTVNGTSGGYGLFKMGASCSATPVLLGVIPNGTVIPARGHYLFVGPAYSLANYGGTGAAAGDQTVADIENDRNVAIFKTGSLLEISTVNRLDAVGFGANNGGTCDLLREGAPLTPTSGSTLEHSYLRDECGKKGNPSTFGSCPTGGFTKDSNVNDDDFFFVDTLATATPMGQRLGAPGPQNLGSPRFTLNVLTLLLDSTKGAAGNPNRVRDGAAIGPNAANGTLSIRRRFQNNTGAPVTKLRIRVVDISTAFISGGGVADLRVLTSGNVTDTVSDPATCTAASLPSPCTVTILGTTLETPPAQPSGGGFNSSVTTGTITLATPLAPGASVNLQILLGVQTTGSFKFFFNIEALP